MQSVEITVISCENLRVGKKPVKKNAFVTARADSPDQCCQTKMSVEGGSNPTWNDKLALDLPAGLRNGFITLEVHCRTSSGNKLVGGVNVPVSDLLGGFMPINHLQFLSYRLWDSKGDRNGIVNISTRVKSPQPYRCSQALQPKAIGVPVGEQKRIGGVVTGVPTVWLGHRYPY
ncbi:BON1-associated protein 2-like [Punica granatum]|uniref:C2 domain-containing protein n=2 Tax=Punica granatum TaxID=22663 RepID=A0A218VUX6_PUNGR|nr:BON1-associated protein 2-like [Punica granatum]OWM64196.1 hypothetical protein CDL15_Pgr018767 [Punica granatum]PKI48823.1 hypothetical protein CRG98_030761 [Punica granatum]